MESQDPHSASVQPSVTLEEQGKTVLRMKLDSLSASLKKLAQVLLHAESETAVPLVEPQIVSRLLGLTNRLEPLKSLEEDEGEVFAAFLKNATDIIETVGVLSGGKKANAPLEQRQVVVRALKNLEDQIKEVLPVVATIDEERRKTNFETFGSLLQKLVDAIQEKRHLLLRNRGLGGL